MKKQTTRIEKDEAMLGVLMLLCVAQGRRRSANGRSLDLLLPAIQASVSFHIHLQTTIALLQNVSLVPSR